MSNLTPDAPAENSSKFDSGNRIRRQLKIIGLAAGIAGAIVFVVAATFYVHYAREIDRQLQAGPFANSVNIYAAPLGFSVGDAANEVDLTAELRTTGYRESKVGNALSYRTGNDYVEIFPARGTGLPARVFIANGQIARIQMKGKDVRRALLTSPLITTLSARKEERLLVTFSEIPKVLVNAILSAEDRHFFQHDGLDLPRILKAAYIDTKDGRKEQGGSTVTMQLVRGLWLEPDKRWKRKLAEVMMAIHLEREWSKKKILETYVNQVYLGRQGDYSVRGFGEAARMFFGKKLQDITLPEAALLAGLIQRPSYLNPFRSPGRARERRDVVLGMMRNNHDITSAQYERAVDEPLGVTEDLLSETRAPYFLDLVNDELEDRQPDGESIRNVYSTIDLNLQRAADEAVDAGMQEVDKLLAKRVGKQGEKPGKKAEVALIALDPRTGEIKALVGGRDYKRSQLNRILSKRPPGSVFKPFVYAAALDTAVSGGMNVYTLASTVDDSATTFWFAGKPYQPENYRGEHFGGMTFRQALAKSDNVAAVKVAQEVGYGAVVHMARRFGLNDKIHATPAIALGAYQVTPLEIARAYTAFANGGIEVKPVVISSFRDSGDGALNGSDSESIKVLDPRVNWLMVSMLEEVMRSGTASSVRSRGFLLPAAGKTGTSRDGWFAGFTTQLLCVVWVGFDDYRELDLEGAKSALPIWTEFMKRASRIGAYRNAKEFPMPAGITEAQICPDSGKLAGEQCPNRRGEFFISGSEPHEKCDLHPVEAISPTVSGRDPIIDVGDSDSTTP